MNLDGEINYLYALEDGEMYWGLKASLIIQNKKNDSLTDEEKHIVKHLLSEKKSYIPPEISTKVDFSVIGLGFLKSIKSLSAIPIFFLATITLCYMPLYYMLQSSAEVVSLEIVNENDPFVVTTDLLTKTDESPPAPIPKARPKPPTIFSITPSLE